MNKPIVRYNPTHNDSIEEGVSAYVVTIDHPVLGSQPVKTSTVQKYDKVTGEFETLNTKYIPDFQ